MTRVDVYTGKDRDDELLTQLFVLFIKVGIPFVLVMLSVMKIVGWVAGLVGIIWIGLLVYFKFFRKKRK